LTGQKSFALAAPRRAQILGAWLAMLALATQCLLIQPHIDGVFASASAETANVQLQTAQPSSDSKQAACVICQAMATAGAFALSASPSLGLIERTFLAAAPVDPTTPVERARSHNWQSRAPPQAI
jgi:hypothetical protein